MTKQFVLAADEVWRLQGGQDSRIWRARGGADPERELFQDMASTGHYGPGAGSKQGIYVCTASGRRLISINSNRPQEVAAALARGLKRWRALPAADRSRPPAASAPKHRLEWSHPKDGLTLTATLRYLPADDDPGAARQREYNHDALWFDHSEARTWLPAKPEPGAEHRLPQALFERIARFNLVDAVRGETRPNQKVSGQITTTVLARDDSLVTIRIAGRVSAENTPARRGLYTALGIEAELLGEARFDLARGRFTSFELVGKGVREAWARRRGRGQQGRAPQRNARSIGWLFTLTPARADGFYVAPTHIRAYGVAWAERDGR